MEKNEEKNKRRRETLDHINRIQGQIEALKAYVSDGKDCLEVATLTTSIAKSFDSLRFRTLEGYLIHQFSGNEVSHKQHEQLRSLLNLYKK